MSAQDLHRLCKADGIRIQVGQFSYCIQSQLRQISDAVHFLYGSYPIDSALHNADFYVHIGSRGLIRRWLKPKVWFGFDGEYPLRPLPKDQCVALLEWGMNFCFSSTAHHLLVVHGASLEKNGRGVVLPAQSGSGKSTLCAGLMGRGWRLLSDEMIIIDPEDAQLVPFPRPVSLKNESISVVREINRDFDFSEAIENTVKGTVAQMLVPDADIARMHERCKLKHIILPRYKNNAVTRIETISPGQGAMALITNSFNYGVLAEKAFLLVADIAGAAEAAQLDFSNLEKALDLIEEAAI